MSDRDGADSVASGANGNGSSRRQEGVLSANEAKKMQRIREKPEYIEYTSDIPKAERTSAMMHTPDPKAYKSGKAFK